MKLFDVYPLYEVTPVRAKDVYVYDNNDIEYLDLYGGHAVISIGHSHPHYVQKIKNQLDQLGFYSNAIQNPLQQQLADAIGEQSCLHDYELFLCSTGAEAIENALKLASFHTPALFTPTPCPRRQPMLTPTNPPRHARWTFGAMSQHSCWSR